MLDQNCILVAGCYGYIGNALTQRLLLEGYKVIGIDNNSRENNVREMGSHSATPQPHHLERYWMFRQLGDFVYLNIDISKNYEDLKDIIDLYNIYNSESCSPAIWPL